MNLNELLQGRYLTKNDVPVLPGVLLHIRAIEGAMIKDRSGIEQMRAIIHWLEPGYKPYLTNKTALRAMHSGGLELSNSDLLQGQALQVYSDPSVNNPSNPNDPGGIRISVPQNPVPVPGRPASSPAPAQPDPVTHAGNPAENTQPPFDDDIPF